MKPFALHYLLILWTALLLQAAPGYAQLGFTQTGEASFYADRFHGKKTASGVRYDKQALTAAHRELPFGTRIRVQNLDNGKSVMVVVNDRGPWRSHRILDLSREAARQLDMEQSGTANIKLVVIGEGSTAPVSTPQEEPVVSTEKKPAETSHPPERRVDPKPQPEKKPEPVQTKPPQEPKPEVKTPEKKPEVKPEVKTLPPVKAEPAKPKPFSAAGTWNMYGEKVSPKGWGVQLGAFSSQEKAVAFCEEVKTKGYQRLFIQMVPQGESHTYKVLLGVYDSADLARAGATELKTKGLPGFPAQHIP
ncbi:MAG: septal ring lytic transglycosylase RlpA family protein [Bacteroidetes bacterium]|nr:septal ring lytic transglycosylase RlpA family protein [Bacteroidota bacterium]